MKIQKLILALSCVLFSNIVWSQTADSLSKAIKLSNSEQYESASNAFRSLLKNEYQVGTTYFYWGENYFKWDKLDSAKMMYQKGADLDPTNPINYVGIGKIQWVQKKETDAKANFFKAKTLAKTYKFPAAPVYVELRFLGKGSGTTLAKYPLNSEGTILMKIAEVYINSDNKNLEEAQSLLEQAVKLESYNPEIYITRGDANLEQNNATKAIEDYEKASTLDPRSVKAILRQGQVWNRAKNYQLALDTYKKASLVDSSYAPAYREKAEIYFRAGQYKNAVAQYKRYLELNNNCSARGRYAGFLNQAKEYALSVEAAKEALKCDPNNVYLYRYLAYSQFESADYAGGLENSNTFFAKVDSNVKIIPLDYEYQAKLLSKNGKDSIAIIAFKKALELQPDKTELNGDIANTYIKMKKYTEAIAAYKAKMAVGKPNANDYYGIGRAYYYSKDFVNADSSFSKIIFSQPDLGLGYLWRAKTNVQLDPKNEKWLAKPFYEQYISKVKPEDVEKNKKDLIDAYTYVGVYYINNKDNCTAKTQFKKVAEFDPANANAKKFLDSAEAKKCQ